MFLSYTVILQYVELRLQVLAAQAVSDGLRDAKAANTLRVYQTAWHLFCEWTLLTDRQSMPAEPQTVAVYLGHLAADGKAMATIARHPAVAEVLKGWRNQAPAPKQADAPATDARARIRETTRLLRRGRGGAWSQKPPP